MGEGWFPYSAETVGKIAALSMFHGRRDGLFPLT